MSFQENPALSLVMCFFRENVECHVFFPHALFSGKSVTFFFSLLFPGKWLVRVLTILTLLLRVKERTKGWVKIKGKTVSRCCLLVFQFERAGLTPYCFPEKYCLWCFSPPVLFPGNVKFYTIFFSLFRYKSKKKHKRMDSNKGEDIMSIVWRSCLCVWVWVSRPQFEWKTK